jgi:prophage tail gpP-like protein
MSATLTNVPTLTINGKVYAGWTEMRVTRALDRMTSDFDLTVTERWTDQTTAWAINPYDACVLAIDNDPVLTGYVDDYQPRFDGRSHMPAGGSVRTETSDGVPAPLVNVGHADPCGAF